MTDLITDINRILSLHTQQAVYIGVHRLRKVMGQYIVSNRGKRPDDDFLTTWIPIAIFAKLETAVRYIVLEEVKRYEEEWHARVAQGTLRDKLGLSMDEVVHA